MYVIEGCDEQHHAVLEEHVVVGARTAVQQKHHTACPERRAVQPGSRDSGHQHVQEEDEDEGSEERGAQAQAGEERELAGDGGGRCGGGRSLAAGGEEVCARVVPRSTL